MRSGSVSGTLLCTINLFSTGGYFRPQQQFPVKSGLQDLSTKNIAMDGYYMQSGPWGDPVIKEAGEAERIGDRGRIDYVLIQAGP